MQLGMVGLGKMGANMTKRLADAGHTLVVTDLNADAVATASTHAQVTGVADLATLVATLSAPRVVWIMVPDGNPTEQTVMQLSSLLEAGDILIDGGNSNYNETLRRGEWLASMGIHMVDVGTSGGIWGLTEGYSLMIGGETEAVQSLAPIFESLAPAPDRGWGHVGPRGSGHFTKMVHNGIEYGMMQAYAEGFEILKAKEAFQLDTHQIARIWQHGSVVRSWLLDLTADALEADPNLSEIVGYVNDSGEGRWTVNTAIELSVPAPVIAAALFARFESRRNDAYANKILAAMRNQFGGHAVLKKDTPE
ncbi:MAG: phosphogluconate dehydrogenase (NAD(+)-dependent, decarboxylating) [Phototrophicaceae bacterium]